MTDRLLTPGEVGRLLRVHSKTVTRWATAGRIAHVRTPTGYIRIPEAVVHELIAGGDR